jgi:hypothetical protein
MVNLVLNWASGVLLIQANQLSDRANETERGSSRRAMFSRCSYEMVIDRRGGAGKPRNSEVDYMTEDVSRRKMLSLLGFGAALGLTLSAALTPFEAEAQEPAPATPAAPAATPEKATGTHGMQRRASRRSHRSERRTARHQRRHTRRTGQPAAPAAPTQ